MNGLDIGLIITGVLFVILSGLLFYYYFSSKRREANFKKAGEGYHPGSYKGWWHRNKWTTMMFLAFTCLIIALSMFAIVIGLVT